MKGISIIGPGRLGGALAIALSRSGRRIDSLIYRTRSSGAEIADRIVDSPPALVPFDKVGEVASPLIIITSGDSEIAAIAGALARRSGSARTVLHTSGSLSSEVLSEAKARGYSTGSIHPLVSVSDSILGAERFGGVYFCVEGEPPATAAANKIASDLGGIPFTIATDHKALYHAAAVTASGHLVTLADAAIEMLSACGLDRSEGQAILMPLIASTVENLKTQKPEKALTGTYARVDMDAFSRHLAALEANVSPELVHLFLAIAERSMMLAKLQGAEPAKVEELLRRIYVAKRNTE